MAGKSGLVVVLTRAPTRRKLIRVGDSCAKPRPNSRSTSASNSCNTTTWSGAWRRTHLNSDPVITPCRISPLDRPHQRRRSHQAGLNTRRLPVAIALTRSYTLTNPSKVIHTSTTRRQKSPHIRDLLQSFHNSTTLHHQLRLSRTMRLRLSMPSPRRRHSIHRGHYRSLFLQARQKNFHSLPASIADEADTEEVFAEDTTVSTTEGEHRMISRNTAKTYPTARRGFWSRPSLEDASSGTRRRMRVFGSSHQT